MHAMSLDKSSFTNAALGPWGWHRRNMVACAVVFASTLAFQETSRASGSWGKILDR